MGDRVSISFAQKSDGHLRESVALYSHWRGMGFVDDAKQYLAELRLKLKKRDSVGVHPIDRLSPETVMVDFIRHITQEEELVASDLYLGRDGQDGDNSDNGHHIIDVDKEEDNATRSAG